MKTFNLFDRWFVGFAVRAAIGVSLAFCPLPSIHAADGDVTAVLSSMSSGYSRAKQADGKFVPEYYSFGEGGLTGAVKGDDIGNVKFLDIARVIARALAEQNYLPANQTNEAKLLIMVHWGTTNIDGTGSGSASPGLSMTTEMSAPVFTGGDFTGGAVVSQSRVTADHNSSMSVANIEDGKRERALAPTARMLGYATALADVSNSEGILQTTRRQELHNELTQQRYFIVLQAFDFQLMAKEKKMNLLWETRLSIGRPGNEFREVLPMIVQYASRYYGQDSHGLKRKKLQWVVEKAEDNMKDKKQEKK